jgi:UPF0755 protein
LKITALGGLTLGLVSALAASLMLRHHLEVRGPALAEPARIQVETGVSLAELGGNLRLANLIEEPLMFAALARWRGLDRRIRSGNYELKGDATVGEIIDLFVSGPQQLELVVIPEGLNIQETARALANAGLGNATVFEKLARDPAFATELGVPGDTLEGYLFPDTYAFAAGSPPAEILAHMRRQFRAVFTPLLVEEGRSRGLEPREIVILASLIEKEAALAEERALISAVFHNRLRRGMKLQSDPTAVYGIQEHSGRVRPGDLDRENPYNTYKISGLPPGPIANPGRAALEAAVRPAADRKILYFVAREDSSHIFSRTYRQHRQAIRE